MQANQVQPSRVRRNINDLVLAELFLVQATIESAAAISDGISELGRQFSEAGKDEGSAWGTLPSLLRQTADEAVEPYATRFRYLREARNSDA